MSEGFQLLVNNDGTQLLFDPHTAKSFTLVSSGYNPGVASHHYQVLNINQHHDVNSITLHYVDQTKHNASQARGKNINSSKSSNKESSTAPLQKTSDRQQTEQKQATTWQTRTHNNTPRSVEQARTTTEHTVHHS
ncbi:unnamed protein product [Rotaria sp. Silwood1]|nr:unnamed protein product [Rotaria sp. Silwood1]